MKLLLKGTLPSFVRMVLCNKWTMDRLKLIPVARQKTESRMPMYLEQELFGKLPESNTGVSLIFACSTLNLKYVPL